MTHTGLLQARVAWLAPTPAEGSGGNRTIRTHIQALARRGVEQHVHVVGSGSHGQQTAGRTTRAAIEDLYGPVPASIRDGLDVAGPFDLAIATVWWTATALAGMPLDGRDPSPCRHAVDEFRSRNGITDPPHPLDAVSVGWRLG